MMDLEDWMRGVWLVPTLNRPHLVKRFVEAYISTKASTPVWFLLDDKDPSKDAYRALPLPQNCLFIDTGEAKTMGDKIRHVWPSIESMDWVGILNDDHIPRTEKWDQAVISQINGCNVAFTNDGYVNAQGPARIAGAICFSGKFLRALGYMFLPGQHHLYSDDLWQVLCQRPQCALYLHDVLVEHDHAYKDKSQQDDTFFKINGEAGLNKDRIGEGGFWPNDRQVFEEWMSSGKAERDIQKIMDIQPKTGVMIATPTHDGLVTIDYALGLSDFNLNLNRQNVHVELARVVGSSLIPHARNSLVDMFLRSKCQKLLFIDADQGFDAQTCWPLFSSPRRIIAGITPHKRYPINLNFDPLPQDRHYFPDLYNKGPQDFVKFATEKADINGEIEVNRAGTGIMCIDRSVFEIMMKSDEVSEYLAFDSSEEHKHKEFFKMGITPGAKSRYVGEDWFFCELAKKLSIPIYIQSRSVMVHSGMHTFRI